MFDDVIIGDASGKGCSATKIFGISNENISENSVSYWITNCICEVGMIIMKDTPEGEKLTRMIENEKPITKSKIQNYLDSLVLMNIKPSLLKIKINNTLKREFEKGRRANQIEIRKALGLNNQNL